MKPRREVVCNPKYLNFSDFLDHVEEAFDASQEVIYKSRNEIRLVQSAEGTLLNVKRFAVPNPLNRLVYTSVRSPKAVRAYRNAFVFSSKGIPTPPPLGYVIHYGGSSLISWSYLVTLQSSCTRNMYEFRSQAVNGRDEIVKGVARLAAYMHNQGVLHLDFSPGNILFEEDSFGAVRFDLVDINRVRLGPVSLKQGCRSFCRLWGREDFFDLIAQEYALLRGGDVGEVRELIGKYHRSFWRGHPNKPF